MSKIDQVLAYKSSKKKKLVAFLALALLLGAGSYFFFTPKNLQSYSYTTHPLHRDDMTIIVSASGYIQPLESVTVGSEVSGTIKEVYVQENDRIKKGDLLARIDATKYESMLKQNEALLDAAKASAESIEVKLQRLHNIVKRNEKLQQSTNGKLPSKDDWENDYTNYLAAKAELAGAKAQVQKAAYAFSSAEYDLQKTAITSPIEGIVLVRTIDPGQTVAASFQTPVLFTIAKDLTKMELEVAVDEADIGKVKVGQSVSFSVDTYLDRSFDATIKKVRMNSEVVDGVVSYNAIMDIDNHALLLKPGMSADADITTKTIKNVFIVPRSALLFNPIEEKDSKMFEFRSKESTQIDPKPHVWILQNKTPQKVYVKVLENEGSLSAIESSELQEDALVIVAQEKKSDTP